MGFFYSKYINMQTITLTLDTLKRVLVANNILITSADIADSTVKINSDDYTILLHNPLTINDRIRLGNWFMLQLAIQLGQVDTTMTRQELIEKLQSYNGIDPEGIMEITLEKNVEILDVQLVERGREKWLEIL
jgi:hypothetical protein